MPSGSTKQLLDRIERLRTVSGGRAVSEKLETLSALSARRISSATQLKKLHRNLLYLRAYPDDSRVFHAVEQALDAFGPRVRSLPASTRAALADSGLEGTQVFVQLSYEVITALHRSYSGRMEIDWSHRESIGKLQELLPHFLVPAEAKAFENGESLGRRWLRTAKGRLEATDLAWLLQQVADFCPSSRERARLFDAAAPFVAWDLTGTDASITANRFAPGRWYVHGDGILRFRGSAARQIARPPRSIKRLRLPEARGVLRMALAALAVRHREVHAFTCANPAEVYLAHLGRGGQAAVWGVVPERRLTLEGNYGYLLLKNGVPIGYGGVSPLFSHGNTGINIFDEYRRGESAFLFVQTLRAFHALFGCTRFVVNPYQFGEHNTEALRSGAFWFYYKLGFRPREPAARRLAAREAAKRRSRKSHRTGPRVLKRLAQQDLHLVLPGAGREEVFDERWLDVCAAGVTARIAREADLRRRRAVGRIVSAVAESLSVRDRGRWPAGQRRAFERLAPLVGLIEDVAGWSSADRKALVALMRAKGSQCERPYVLRLRRHRRLRLALPAYCRRARRQARLTDGVS